MEDKKKDQIKALKSRTFGSDKPSFNPSLYPARKIDTALYEDILSRSEEFGVGSVLAGKLSVYEEGATLLDLFAESAMHYYMSTYPRNSISDEQRQFVAKNSYDMAKSMLEAREDVLKKMDK